MRLVFLCVTLAVVPSLSARVRLEDEDIAGVDLPEGPRLFNHSSPVSADLQLETLETTHFNGIWDCVRTEGDFEGFLVAQKVGWFQRRMASNLHYGVGHVKLHLTVSDDFGHMKVDTKAPLYNDHTTYPLDNSEFPTKNSAGKKIWIKSRWAGDVIEIETQDGVHGRTFVRDDELFSEYTFDGVTAANVWKRA
mmetsp:Transcript_2176/g.6165  ORF Transcript_2176/g.6165 Transcript_2176/m.6165 type:complete len:193 (-) Transcript_2176:100-678(-)